VEADRIRSTDAEVGCVIPLTVRQFSIVELRQILVTVARFGWTRATLTEDPVSGRFFVAAQGTPEAVRQLVTSLPADPVYRDGLLKRLHRTEISQPMMERTDRWPKQVAMPKTKTRKGRAVR
jgi:hypothetical protein